MKLQDIQPGKQSGKEAVMTLQRAAQKHLIMQVSGYTDDTHRIYIISDVPSTINEKQWDRLYEVSFPTGSISEYGNMIPIHLEYTDARDGRPNLKEWYRWFELTYGNELARWTHSHHPPVKVLKWKEFVAYVKAENPLQPDEEDDFDE